MPATFVYRTVEAFKRQVKAANERESHDHSVSQLLESPEKRGSPPSSASKQDNPVILQSVLSSL